MKHGLRILIVFLSLTALLSFPEPVPAPAGGAEEEPQISDHFNGSVYFNPGFLQSLPPPPGQAPSRSRPSWIWRLIFGTDWPAWPEIKDPAPGPPPVDRVPRGSLSVTPVGHATFLIQMDGLNILTDPMWSDRCSPLSWAGPKRHRKPGLRFEDLPVIDVLLLSHNHYDHLDLPTLQRLAAKGVLRAIVPLGNQGLVRGAGIPSVDECDWWQSVQLTRDVTITLVPAQHFSSRTLWDRDRALWGGFVVSGPAGNVFYAGDTGYGTHFRSIAGRFSPLRVALLPISPFQPRQGQESPAGHRPGVHMGPAEAVQAHLDLGAQVSIAAHFQVFQLGADGFDDAVNGLASVLKERHLPPDAFIAPVLGRAVMVTPMNQLIKDIAAVGGPLRFETSSW